MSCKICDNLPNNYKLTDLRLDDSCDCSVCGKKYGMSWPNRLGIYRPEFYATHEYFAKLQEIEGNEAMHIRDLEIQVAKIIKHLNLKD